MKHFYSLFLLLFSLFFCVQQATATVPSVPFSMTSSLFSDSQCKVSSSGDNAWDSSNGIRLGGSSTLIAGSPARNWDDKYVIIHFNGIPDTLTFELAVNKSGTFGATEVEWYVQESSSSTMPSDKVWTATHDETSFTSASIQLQKDTRYVKICYSGNFAGYVKNVKISKLEYVENPEPSTLDLGTAAINYGEVSGTMLVNWCNVSELSVNVSSDRFTVSPTSFGAVNKYGSQQLTVTYNHTNEVGAHDDTITITNGTYTKYVRVLAETTRRPQTIQWNTALVSTDSAYVMNVGESYPNESMPYIAVTANGGRVTFESDKPDVIEVVGDTLLVAKAAGTANITAMQAGDNEYQPVEETNKFVVTNFLKQTITWEQNLLNLLTTSNPVELTATASSGGDIVYTSADESVVTVNGNVLTVVGEGETYITATQAGGDINGEEYIAVSLQNMVIVRNPASQCSGRSLSVGTLTLSSSNLSKEYTLAGPPQTLTFSALHGSKSGSWGTTPNYAALVVEQYACVNNLWDWYSVYNKVVGTSATASGNITLEETATKIRFRTTETGTTHTISSISVTRKKYLRANISQISTEAEANAIWQQEIIVSHSNIDLMTVAATAPFAVSTLTLGEGCGDYGSSSFTISFTPTEKDSTYEGSVTITDGKDNPSTIVIPISITSKGLNQAILNFDLPETAITTDRITLSATASSGLEIGYQSSDSAIAFVDDNELVILSSGTVDITAFQAGNEKYDYASEKKTIVISKTPVVISELPVAADIHYGDSLSASELTGGEASVEGSFAWADAEVVLGKGVHSQTVIFTPQDNTIYDTAHVEVTVVVDKAVVTITELPAASSLVYGETIAQSELTGGEASVEGSFVWADSTFVPVAGDNFAWVLFLPDDADNYDMAVVQVQVNVTKAVPQIIDMPVVDEVYVGTELVSVPLIGGEASVDGEFVWADATIVLSEAGEYSLAVNFVPADSLGYNVVSLEVSLVVLYQQDIIWTDDLAGLSGGDSVVLTAEATSGLEIEYISSDSTIAVIIDNVLYILSDGEVTITAVQTGNDIYAPTMQEREIVVVEKSVPNSVSSLSAEDGKLLRIYTVTGRLLTVINTTGSDNDVLRFGLPQGVYLFQYENATRRVVIGR